MPTLPTVDVVVPCYNYARYLPQCVNSVLTQPGVEVRVTVIDDCSSDESAEVAARLALDDSRVRFVLHEVNRGHLATYVEGLDAATADYVVLLSADDLLTPGALGRATGLMQAHPNVGFVYGYPIPLYDAQLPAARTRSRGWSVRPGRDWIANMCESGRNLINCPEVVMRTSVQHAIGHFSPTLPHSGDMEMWMRAAAVADVGHLRGVDQAYYRIHNRSMQRTTHAGFLVDLKGRLAAFESAFAGGASRVAGAPQLLATARRALAIEAVERA
ncbi:MAG: gtuS2-9, partial [Rhizobacter sp.]|nr:gtuS2-9 [Rhizobacter sp.]